jgi:homoserine dehydrogenase
VGYHVKPFRLALLGLGTVGGAVAKLLLEEPVRMADRCGRPIQVAKILVRDSKKERVSWVPKELITTDLNEVVGDSTIDLVVELVGGCDWALKAIEASLRSGKDVVTANKAVLAQHGARIFQTARESGTCLAFEGSVGGGIPIIGALVSGLGANRIVAIQGILNGTSNYILSRMCEDGLDYLSALKAAQKLGYAEADPTLDVDGTDAAHKLMVLAQIGFKAIVGLDSIPRRGIDQVDSLDIHYADELGYTIKLLAECWSTDSGLAMHVSPVLLRKSTPLAQVRGAYNAIRVVGDAVGDTLFYGLGAGGMPTASAVVGDIISLAIGRGFALHQASRLWCPGGEPVRMVQPGGISSRFYLRLLVSDRPGVMAGVAGVLARHHISISSVIQHEISDEQAGGAVQMVIMTHTATAGDFEKARVELAHLDYVANSPVHYPIGE